MRCLQIPKGIVLCNYICISKGNDEDNNNNNNNLFYSVIDVIISNSVCDATYEYRVGRSIRRSLSAYGSSITKYNLRFTV